jgi:hypothetical protein
MAPTRADRVQTVATTTLPHPQFHYRHHPDRSSHRLCQPLTPAIEGAPPRWSDPSSSSAPFAATTPLFLPSLSHYGPLLWSISEPLTPPELRTNIVNSLEPLAGTLGCSSGRSPARTRRLSTSPPPASLVSLSSPPNPPAKSASPGLAPRPLLQRPSAGRILPASRWCRWGRELPCSRPQAERPMRAG